MQPEPGAPDRSSLSASQLHARLQAATRAARDAARHAPDTARARRRVADAEAWAFLQALSGPVTLIDPSLSVNRAVRRVAAALLEEARDAAAPLDLETVTGPVLIVRSGPWPVLGSLLARVAAQPAARPVTVLCHARDRAQLDALGESLGLPIEPLLYPRFGPFGTTTLRRLIGRRTWATAIVLDGSRTGQGQALEHVTAALEPGRIHVWNASGQAWALRPLRERLGTETYRLLHSLLRWRARRGEP